MFFCFGDLPRPSRREWELAHNVVDHISVLTANYGVFFCNSLFFPPLEICIFAKPNLSVTAARRENKTTKHSQASLGKGAKRKKKRDGSSPIRICLPSNESLPVLDRKRGAKSRLPPTCLMFHEAPASQSNQHTQHTDNALRRMTC
ncbi:hypothetical protein PgNI_06199 [Pyricularia grisea]|uniref:Uncharacterized protein n=1 Tax=Pyricularia grisea TaxID=148305 RepID=A0A6P8B7M1_PYRGI|nr:hypothetical protein PgNI_06199 [Pyricularia grisea]TLD11238.1 hypothetical protein PgNI_06199 [Pyricularia grisea]